MTKQNLILQILSQHGEMSGLDIVKASSGRLRRGTVYVHLSQLESQRLISAREILSQKTPGMPKRLYSLTMDGFTAISKQNLANLPASRIKHVRKILAGA